MKIAIIGAMDKEIERYLELYNATVVDDKRKIYKSYNVIIAHVARKNKVPFITIRIISDFANGNDEFEKLASDRSSEIIYKCIEKLLTNEMYGSIIIE